jgi:recombinational DNA repair protein (RecF pathway)
MTNQCEMVVGFLTPHRCDNAALGRCVQCGRSYCDEHVSVTTQGLTCLACQQGLAQPIALPITAQTYDQTDLTTFALASTYERDLNDDTDTDDDTFDDLS